MYIVKPFSILITAVLLATGPTLAAAQTDTYDDTPSFQSLDDNADGRLSPEEAEGADIGDVNFQDADVDDDGFLSPDEYESEIVDPIGSVSMH